MALHHSLIEVLLAILVLTNVFLLTSSRLVTLIQIAAAQGILLGALTFALRLDYLDMRVIGLGLVSAALKGVVFPLLFIKAIRAAHITREVEPLVGYVTSLLVGGAVFVFSTWMGARLPFAVPIAVPILVPASFFTLFTGAFLIVSRSKAITQVIGYLVMENGIYVFGTGFMGETSTLVELGILLDVFVGVFVMQIILHHINREFESLNVNKLSQLRDWEAS